MKPQNIIICLLSIGIVILLCVHGCNNSVPVAHTIDYKKTIDSLQSINKKYSASLKSYEQKNDNLIKQLAATEVLLSQAKTKLIPIRRSVRKVIRENWDTISKEIKLVKCDSLKDLVTEYEEQIAITDSLTDQKIATLNAEISAKDEQLLQCSESYDEVKKVLEESINDNKTCSTDLKKITKKMKRKQFFNKVLGTGVGVAVIAVAALLVVGM